MAKAKAKNDMLYGKPAPAPKAKAKGGKKPFPPAKDGKCPTCGK